MAALRRFGVFLSLCLLGCGEQLPVRHYTVADGLAGNAIRCILSDSHGFLWFGTDEGLSRFDGYQFTNFTEAQGLPHRNVFDIIETRGGVYWLATGAGPCRFDPASRGPGSRFTPYPLERRAATSLLEDRSGTIWFGTNAGLFRLPKGGAAVAAVDIGTPFTGGGNTIISALLEDSQGSLWIGTSDALYRRAMDGRTRRYTAQDGLPINYEVIEALLEDRQGQIWIGTRNGLCRTIPHAPLDRLLIAQVYGAKDFAPYQAWTNSLLQSSDGKLWAGTIAALHLFTGPQGSHDPPFRTYTTAHGLAEGGMGPMAEDRAGNLWIGTDGHGAMKIARNGFLRFTKDDGITSNHVLSMFESQQGELIGIGAAVTRRPLPHHRTYGSVYGGSRSYASSPRTMTEDRAI